MLSKIFECLVVWFFVNIFVGYFWILFTEVFLLSGEQDPCTRDVLVLGETVDIPNPCPGLVRVSNGL